VLREFPGARIETGGDAPTGEHPLWIELARVRMGRFEVEGLDQREWARAMGTAWLGAPAAALELVPGLAPAARIWSRTVETLADAWSSGASAAFGTYHELMLGVPNVHLANGRGGPFMLVLGMYTDSPIAKWGDDVLRCGYNKRMARFSRSDFDDYSVTGDDGQPLVRLSTNEHADEGWSPLTTVGGLEPFRVRLDQPLLGYLGKGEYALTALERSYSAEVMGRRVGIEIVTGPGFDDALASGRHRLDTAAGTGFGAIQLAGIPTKLTYPRHFGVDSD
jgi:hypothetical protein